MAACRNARQILVLGGGDGLAVREILRYATVESVTLGDLDPAMTSLADRFPPLAELTGNALRDSRVTVINQDAFLWIDEDTARFDAVIIDFPDPGTYSVGKLYTSYFFSRLRQRLAPQGVVTIQCSSPLVSPKSYWCVINTLEQSGFRVRPFQATVPTFGVWGFALAAVDDLPPIPQLSPQVSQQLRFLDQTVLDGLFIMPKDISPVETEINRLNNQVLVRYYDREWSRWQ